VNVLVIVAHPCADSFTHACAATAEHSLRQAGHHVDVVDLYAAGFRVAMSAEERAAYHGDEPIVDPLVGEHAALVRSAEWLVFVYPTWWSGLPAILKGWLERVMVPGTAFSFDERGSIRRELTQVRRIVGISTYGSPRPYVAAINDNGRRVLTRALRLTCGIRTRTTWIPFYAIDTATDAQRAEFLSAIDLRLARLT
jgi:putative NADPH-quinone reductase